MSRTTVKESLAKWLWVIVIIIGGATLGDYATWFITGEFHRTVVIGAEPAMLDFVLTAAFTYISGTNLKVAWK